MTPRLGKFKDSSLCQLFPFAFFLGVFFFHFLLLFMIFILSCKFFKMNIPAAAAVAHGAHDEYLLKLPKLPLASN